MKLSVKLFLAATLTVFSVVGQSQAQSTTEDPELYACSSEPTSCKMTEWAIRSAVNNLEVMQAAINNIHRLSNITETFKETLTELVQSIKTRQEASAVVQIIQLLLFISYLLTICICQVVSYVKNKQEQEQEFQPIQMKSCLAERKKKSNEERKKMSLRPAADEQ